MEASGVVLLVEDDEKTNKANRHALEFRRFTVHTATSFAEAHRLLGKLQPDIIMMEVNLPDGDGFDFCKRIYGVTDANIVFLTSKTGNEDMVRGIQAGGDEYINKPYYKDEMIARVEALMRRRKPLQASV